MTKADLESDKKFISKQLSKLIPLMQNYATGDFSQEIEIPEEENEFTELLVGLRLMVDDIRELIQEKDETITESKLAEEALHKYEHIVSSSSDMMAFLDNRFIYQAANRAYLETFKLTPEKLIGHTVSNVFGKEFFNTVIKPNANRCLGGEEVNYQDWFDFPVHGQCYMDITYYPYYSEHNRITGFVVNGRNITERKTAEDIQKFRSEFVLTMSKHTSLKDVSDSALSTILLLGEFDSGGVYLVDEKTGAVDLEAHKGLPDWFIDMATHFESDDPRVQLIMAGKPIYQHTSDFPATMRKELTKDGIKALAVIPFRYGGKVIGALNLASHTHDVLTTRSKRTVEAIAESDLGGNITRVIAIQALLEREKRLTTLYENVNEVIFYLDVEAEDRYRFQSVNAAFLKSTGLKANQVVGKLVSEIIPEPSLSLVLSNYRKAVHNRESVRWEEITPYPSGNKVGDVTINPVFDEHGKCTGLIGTVYDITDRKRAEEELKISQERLFFATEGANVGVWNWNILADELIWSDKCKSLFGVPLDETMNYQRFSEALHPDDRERTDKAVKEALDNHEDYDIEYRSLWPDGSIHWLAAKGRGFYDVTGKALRLEGVVLDITDSKRTMEELKKHREHLEELVKERTLDLENQKAEAEELSKELEAFAYSVSHDLRAPLRHIFGFSTILENRLSSGLDEKSCRQLHNISEAAHQMSTLIEDLLVFSRIGRSEMRKTLVDLKNLTTKVVADMKPETKERKVTWKIEHLPKVYVDQSMIKQVFINLVSNAVKFTGKKREAKIEIGYQSEKDQYVIYVRDNGVGFNMKYVGKLYQVFQRLHSEAEFKGTGIGLANVQRIINRHEGRVWAESTLGKGATFYFSLPK